MRQKSAFLGMAAAAAFSGASFSAFAAPCTSTGWSTYLSGGTNATCTVLDAIVSNATFSSTTIPLSSALVDLSTATNNPGLLFSVGTSIAGTATITFTITAPSSHPFTDASVSAGDVQLAEMLSNGSSLSAPPGGAESTTFAPIASLNVTDQYTLAGGGVSDDAFFNVNFSESTAAVPEPSSLALLGIGLPALGLVRRRKRP